MILADEQIQRYKSEGVLVIRNLFTPWIDRLNPGADQNIAQPSKRAINRQRQKVASLKTFATGNISFSIMSLYCNHQWPMSPRN
jgi:hypothetical protein